MHLVPRRMNLIDGRTFPRSYPNEELVSLLGTLVKGFALVIPLHLDPKLT